MSRLQPYISAYLDEHAAEFEAIVSPADITWGQDRLVQPDLFVVPEGEVTNDWSSYKTLLLAVEILSPSSARSDRIVKRKLYQERGVATYWVVDIDATMVEVWHPADERPEIATDMLTEREWHGSEELRVDLAELFSNLPQ